MSLRSITQSNLTPKQPPTRKPNTKKTNNPPLQLVNSNPLRSSQVLNTLVNNITHFPNETHANNWVVNYLDIISHYGDRRSMCGIMDIDGTILTDRGENRVPMRSTMLYDIFNRCRQMKIPIYIITARPDGKHQRQWTKKQLAQCGYEPDTYEELIMMPTEELQKMKQVNGWNFSDYKFKARQRIGQQLNKAIIFNIGDQWSDLFRTGVCCPNKQEENRADNLENLPNTGVYAASLLEELCWLSVKVPH
jgi:hypothetical protein